ncbi:MAG: hypothetical protein GC150_12280 [Rhizobiales bacterium]|nr:hypothetical protein [Hyphomicrobiales bacterium]
MATKTTGETASATLINRVANWLVAEALLEPDVTTLVTGTCERLHAAGIALVRGYAAFPVLHPLHSAIGITWLRGQGTSTDGYPHVPGGVSAGFERSPHYYMLQRDLDFLRVKLDCPTRSYQFDVFDDLRAEHVTDYLAYVVSFEPQAGRRAGRGNG